MTVRGTDYSVIKLLTKIRILVSRVIKMAYVKADKLHRIYTITENSSSNIVPEEYKPTLNMFRGRQIETNLKDCLKYLKISLAAQSGDEEAEKELRRIHYTWNHDDLF